MTKERTQYHTPELRQEWYNDLMHEQKLYLLDKLVADEKNGGDGLITRLAHIEIADATMARIEQNESDRGQQNG